MPGKVIDLTGQTFGRLEVLKFVGVRDHNALWQCRCILLTIAWLVAMIVI
jgi:hypothetical protein